MYREERKIGREAILENLQPSLRDSKGAASAAVPQGTRTHEGLRVCVRTKRKPQISPLRYPGFPVDVGGVGKHHAPFFKERRTRGLVQRRVAGNPGTLRSR